MSKKVKLKWADFEQKMFGKIKSIVVCNILLIYTDFNTCLIIHMNASNLHLEAVISKGFKPIAFYSGKITCPQTWYTATEK